MIVKASEDDELCSATYLPRGLDVNTASDWLAERPELCWVLICDGVPCGVYELGELRGTIEFRLPSGALEREVWLLEPFRGRGVVRHVTQQLASQLVECGVRHILGVAWVENQSALSAMKAGGFYRLGRSWWQADGHEPGWCECWQLDL